MKILSRKYSRTGNIIVSHIQKNSREYLIASIIFIIGILLGIVFVNNLNTIQTDEITEYLTGAVASLKESESLSTLVILKSSIQNNILLVIILWLMGSTVIGLLLVFLIVCFKGFCLGYTISSIVFVLGTGKGVILFLINMFLKNIISIPCIIALTVSGMKVYNSIMQDRRKENIKLEIIRHTIFAAFILALLILSSFLEVYVSQVILKYCIKYI